MRRLPYQDKKNASSINRNRNPKQEIDQIKFRLQLNRFVPTPGQSFFVSRTTKPSPLQKQQQKMTPKRPYTTQRSNSLNQIKKQDYGNVKKNMSLDQNIQLRTGFKNQNDYLWISAIKDVDKDNDSLHFSLRLNDPLMSRGKLWRGIALKQEEKKIFTKANSFDSKRARISMVQSSTPYSERQSQSRSQKKAPIDLIGRNLRLSLNSNSKPDQKENFFEYVMRFSYKTKKGYTPTNPNKINQDSYITFPNVNNKTWEHLFGICDGHGPLGHLVSDFIKNSLPESINKLRNIQKNPLQSLHKAFDNTYDKLIRDSHIDMMFSGSTVIACYFLQNKLYCCNVGDSRAIMGKQKNNIWAVLPLSTDHKPSLPLQAQRIKKSKGRVEAYKDQFGQDVGPLRVWLKNDNVPGLAMTRSFGDLVGESVGVCHQPQIKQFVLNQEDKIILIASDGVFQFLQNQQIIDALVTFYEKKQIQQASDHLLGMAHRSWNRNSSIIDDITFILIFMNYNQ